MTKSIFILPIVFMMVSGAYAQNLIEKKLYHEFNTTALTDNSQQEFEKLILQLKQFDVQTISVSSHTDKHGSHNYNDLLSQERNLSILQKLHAQLPSDITYTTGYYGKDSLLTLNDLAQDKNRRTVITVFYRGKDNAVQAEITELVPYQEDVPEQRFEINLDDTVSITAKEGTFIKFPPGSFLSKSKKTAKGNAVLVIKEYYSPGDILLSGMHSMADNGLLQTSGMFKLRIIQDGDTMVSESVKPVQIRIPDKNNLSEQMNVFTTDRSDTSIWKDTRQAFTRVESSWSWPYPDGKLRDFFVDYSLPYNRWEKGRKWSDEYRMDNPIFDRKNIIRYRSNYKPAAKTVRYTIEKTDSTTLTVNVHEKFRRRGVKKYNTRSFDTTFLVKYSTAVYETIITGLNFINCDRFLNSPDVTEFYVKTPGFENAQMLVYFKNLNAFMQAGNKKGRYEISRVPPGEEVYLIAVGRKGNEYYFGKESFTISKKATAKVSLQKVKYEEMKTMFKLLGYKS